MGITDIIKATIKLDIYDMNYLYSSEEIHILENNELVKVPRKGIFFRIATFIVHLIESTYKTSWKLNKDIPKGMIMFYFVSRNQKSALEPIARRMSNSFSMNNGKFQGEQYPLIISYIISIFFLPLVLTKYFTATGYIKSSFKYIIDYYLLSYGYYLTSRIYLKKLAPSCLILSNDHTMWCRIIKKAAADENITTIYIQHAPITRKFPPLSFDYALLEGLDALYKYDSIGKSNSIVFLIGMPKFDHFVNYINLNNTVNSIGICANLTDPIDPFEDVCRLLLSRFSNIKLTLRPHPGDNRRQPWKNLAEILKIRYSDSFNVNAFEFLKSIDVIIAGGTAIHLDAVMLNVYPIYYYIHTNYLLGDDPYDFKKNKLLDEMLKEPEDLVIKLEELIRYRPKIRNRATAYSATVDTDFDGHSSEISASVIKGITNPERDFQKNMWKKIAGLINLEAYDLRNNE